MEVSFYININYIAYLLLGIGVGMAFYFMFYENGSQTKLERMKHDVEVKKEFFRMKAELLKKQGNKNGFSRIN